MTGAILVIITIGLILTLGFWRMEVWLERIAVLLGWRDDNVP